MKGVSSPLVSTISVTNLSPSPPQYNPKPLVLKISSVRKEENQEYSTTTTKSPSSNKQNPQPYSHKSASQKTAPSPPPPRPKPSVAAAIFNSLDHIINNFIDPPLHPSVDPRCVLSGNFAPVNELPPTECAVVQGSLPPSLDGAYIRNGPNPQFLPRGPYHLFDGDGMLHAIRISGGRATLCSRYVKTYKYAVEQEMGSQIIPNVFSGFNGLIPTVARGLVAAARVLTGQFNPTNGIGLANTSLALFGKALYALGESDLPYAVTLSPDGDIATLGRRDFDGKLFISMTAHPKTDPETGETFGFRYGPVPPFLTYFRFSADGMKQPDVPIFSVKRPSFFHDFAVTRNYAVFVDIQFEINPIGMVVGGAPMRLNPKKVTRVGIIQKNAMDEGQMRWFEVPGFNIIHVINAWEEEDGGDAVVMVAPNILSMEHFLERVDLIHGSVEKVRIDLKTGMVSRQTLAARNLDMAVINQQYVGKKNRYIYAAIRDPTPKFSGVVKIDLSMSEDDHSDCAVTTRKFGQGCYGGEPFFVARDPCNPTAEEDDGYVITYVHNENNGESLFLVMDAKSPNLDIVAKVKLPHRVPYGFHGLFVRESDLSEL